MAELPVSIRSSVQRYIEVLRQYLPHLDAVYVYGSQTQGTMHEWSDIDVAVVSPDFGTDLFQERVMLLRLAAQVDDRIEAAPFTPQDFTPDDPLVHEIQRTGLRLV